jgi:pantoate--beta-alanine ligase
MEVERTIEAVRQRVRQVRSQGKWIGFVPTMGALHEGHRSLIRAARQETDFVVVSIFVNPTQFGPSEDYLRYPRPFEKDVQVCAEEGVDLVFAPDVETMYPSGFCTYVTVEGLSQLYEGRFRPGHFRGVATVVLKLFHIVEPDVAYFGQKDAQQARIVRQMIRDLNLPVTLVVCPTVREPDGLAVSSRNTYLEPHERQQALALSSALYRAAELVRQGQRCAERLRGEMLRVLQEGPVQVDYADVVDPETFLPVEEVTGEALAIVAARVGSTRLIDNLLLWPPEMGEGPQRPDSSE